MAQPRHVHGVGDDDVLELELIAQQAGEHQWRDGGGDILRLDGGHGHVRGHDGVDSVRDGSLERLQLDRVHVIAVFVEQRQVHVAIDGGVAVAGEMLGGHQHAIVGIGMRAVDERRDVARDGFGILSVGADVDDGIVGIVVDVGDGREDPLHSQSSGFACRGQPFVARRFQIAGRAVGHVVRKADRVGDAHGRGALKIPADQQWNFRQLLHAVQEHRHGVGLGVAHLPVLHGVIHDQPADVQVADPVTPLLKLG